MHLSEGTMVAIMLFAVAHTAAFIWWMSKVTTNLDNVMTTLKSILATLATHEASFVRKEDFAKDMGQVEKRLDAAWNKIDGLTGKI